jgi:hypothetical protein
MFNNILCIQAYFLPYYGKITIFIDVFRIFYLTKN